MAPQAGLRALEQADRRRSGVNEGLQNQGEKESGDRVIEGRRGVLGGRNIQLMVLACTAGGTSPEK